MDVAEYYRTLLTRREEIANENIADVDAFRMQSRSHNYLKDYDAMLAVINGPERTIFEQGCREYQYSLEAVICGNYRHAFASLRLSFELFVGSIYFSAHLLKMRLWESGNEDLHWAVITDKEKGVYSHIFLRAFNGELGPYRTQYMELASTVYRECSEYVHGNPNTLEDTNLSAMYEPDISRRFHENSETVKLCVLFAFCVRYTLALTAHELSKLEGMILGDFGDVPEIQALFEVTSR